jgi:hypothetical protein
MTMQYNPDTMSYTMGAGALAEPLIGEPIVGALDPTTQYGLAARQIFGQRRFNPWVNRAMSRAYEPMYGRYIAGDPTQEQTFAQFTRGYDPATGISFPQGQSPLEQAVPTGAPSNWANIVNVARSMAAIPYTQGGAIPSDVAGYQPPSDAASAMWTSVLNDPEQLRALTSMATYDPRAGTIRGRMREAARGGQQERFFADNPAATGVDWLGYITGQPGMTRTGFGV